MKVGFVAPGNMGSAMARNVIKAGHTRTVYNRRRSRSEEFLPLGAAIVGTPREAASRAEALIAIVADYRVLEAGL